MRFKQKLAYMALGGALVFAGMLLPTILINTAQTQTASNGKFNTVTAQELNIVDAKGNVVVKIADGFAGGDIWLYGRNQRVQANIGVENRPGAKGGFIELRDNSGTLAKPSVLINVTDQGGRVAVYRANGQRGAMITVAEYGGVLMNYNLNGGRASAVGVDSNGRGFLAGYVATPSSR